MDEPGSSFQVNISSSAPLFDLNNSRVIIRPMLMLYLNRMRMQSDVR
ncbi:hypothetical protein LINPERHAP2_LOCUS10793 [Linum perenne]